MTHTGPNGVAPEEQLDGERLNTARELRAQLAAAPYREMAQNAESAGDYTVADEALRMAEAAAEVARIKYDHVRELLPGVLVSLANFYNPNRPEAGKPEMLLHVAYDFGNQSPDEIALIKACTADLVNEVVSASGANPVDFAASEASVTSVPVPPDVQSFLHWPLPEVTALTNDSQMKRGGMLYAMRYNRTVEQEGEPDRHIEEFMLLASNWLMPPEPLTK